MSGEIGISTACFYPLETELSFEKLCKAGIGCCEIFFNTESELEESYVSALAEARKESGIKVTSLHPFGSFTESYGLFSSYVRRYRDYLELYKRYFSVMNRIGAKVLVIHGAKYTGSIPDEEVFERFGELSRIGAGFGCVVAQENVVHYKSESPDFMSRMKEALGSDFAAVLDNKQAYRAGFEPQELIDVLGTDIVHVHLSDHSDLADCVPPGEGCFDFKRLFSSLISIGYRGDYSVELYSKSYSDELDVYKSRDYLEGVIKNVKKA